MSIGKNARTYFWKFNLLLLLILLYENMMLNKFDTEQWNYKSCLTIYVYIYIDWLIFGISFQNTCIVNYAKRTLYIRESQKMACVNACSDKN